MADPFSYSGDIAPMQQRFFGSLMGSRDLSTSQKNSMAGAALNNQIKFNESLMKLQESRIANVARDLQFEEATMRLRKTREEMDRQKDMYRELPVLQKELEDIQSDPDEESKQRRISVFGIRNAAKITNVPEIDQAFRAASYGVNRGSQARPSVTFGELVMKGVPNDVLGLADDTDLNSAVPSSIAANAIRYIADNQVKTKQAEDNQKLAKENQAKIEKIYGDTASFLQKIEYGTTDSSIEFAGSNVMRYAPPEKQAEFQKLVADRKAIENSKDDKKDEKLKPIRDKIINSIQGVVLDFDPTKPLGTAPTESSTTSTTRNLFSSPTK
jgi:hypothetical protein